MYDKAECSPEQPREFSFSDSICEKLIKEFNPKEQREIIRMISERIEIHYKNILNEKQDDVKSATQNLQDFLTP